MSGAVIAALDTTDIERVLVGSFLVEPALLDQVPDLAADHFRHPHMAAAFGAIRNAVEAGEPITIETVWARLPPSCQDDYALRLGSAPDLDELVNEVKRKASEMPAGWIASRISPYAGIVRQARADEARAVAAAEATRSEAVEIMAVAARDDEPMLRSVLLEDAASADTPPIRSYSTGNPQLDHLLGAGINTRELCVVLGPPGACKTAWAVSTALHIERNVPVLYASTELEQHELQARAVANVSGKPWSGIRRGVMDREERRAHVAGRRIHLIGCETLPRDGTKALELVEREAEALAKKYGTAPAIVIDYLQDLARGATERDIKGRVGDLAVSVRIMSQRLDCPAVAVSSIGRAYYNPKRAGELRAADDPAVYLAAAKESGDVDYAAARVLFLDADDDRDKPERMVRIAVAKSRDGRVGFAGARVIAETGRFIFAPASVAAMSASGRSEQASAGVDRADDDAVLAGIELKHRNGERELCTRTYLRDAFKPKLSKPRAEHALDRLVNGAQPRARIVPINRVEGDKTKTREIYEPIAAITGIAGAAQVVLDIGVHP